MIDQDVQGELRLIAAILQQALFDSADGMRIFSKEKRGPWTLEASTARMVELNEECAKLREEIDSLQAQLNLCIADSPYRSQIEKWLKEERKEEEQARFRRVRHMVPFEALRWLLDETNNAPMSCRWICDNLGLDHQAVVEQIGFGSRQLARIKGPHNVRPEEVA